MLAVFKFLGSSNSQEYFFMHSKYGCQLLLQILCLGHFQNYMSSFKQEYFTGLTTEDEAEKLFHLSRRHLSTKVFIPNIEYYYRILLYHGREKLAQKTFRTRKPDQR